MGESLGAVTLPTDPFGSSARIEVLEPRDFLTDHDRVQGCITSSTGSWSNGGVPAMGDADAAGAASQPCRGH